jgi:hypothetical protein
MLLKLVAVEPLEKFEYFSPISLFRKPTTPLKIKAINKSDTINQK